MKKTLFIFLAAILLLNTACSDDDSSSNPEPTSSVIKKGDNLTPSICEYRGLHQLVALIL